MSARKRSRNGHNAVERTHRYACYCRVSTEDQAAAQTIQAQIAFLRGYCELHGLPVFDVYCDDGVSGTVPLEDRPEGRRMLEDAAAGAFDVVLVWRIDRLGRSLKSLIMALDHLNGNDIDIRSGTEPFDTTTPFGKAMFQFLGIIAELEKATIGERLTHGRDRVAKQGQYTGGPIPFGFDLDEDRRYVPSARLVDGLGITEAEVVRAMFERIAFEQSTLYAERARLSALGIPTGKRYPAARRASKAKLRPAVLRTEWAMSTVDQILHNEMYKGPRMLESVNGPVERPSPGIVPAEVWDLVQVNLANNRTWSPRNSKRDYLLRGLPKCSTCTRTYTGDMQKGRQVYRCPGIREGEPGYHERPCSGGQVNAAALESAVWDAVKAFAQHPREHLAEAQQQLRAQLSDANGQEQERKRLIADLATFADQRERVLDLYRRGRITPDECDRDLEKVEHDKQATQKVLDRLARSAGMAAASEAYLSDVGAALQLVADGLAEIERDPSQQRELIATLTTGIIVHAIPLGQAPGQRSGRVAKRYEVEVRLAYQRDARIVSVTDSRNGDNSPVALLEVVRRVAVA